MNEPYHVVWDGEKCWKIEESQLIALIRKHVRLFGEEHPAFTELMVRWEEPKKGKELFPRLNQLLGTNNPRNLYYRWHGEISKGLPLEVTTVMSLRHSFRNRMELRKLRSCEHLELAKNTNCHYLTQETKCAKTNGCVLKE